MFTGLVEAMGNLISHAEEAGGKRLILSHSFPGLCLGESISVSGACLTVVAFDDHSFAVQASPETLELSTLGSLTNGSQVNLERAMPAGARLGGHLVTGHVDGLGEVKNVTSIGDMTQILIEVPPELRKYIAKKGSITVEGVSLTVNEVSGANISLLIIPHTRRVTTLGGLRTGDRVNLEVDLVARYVERLLSESGTLPGPTG